MAKKQKKFKFLVEIVTTKEVTETQMLNLLHIELVPPEIVKVLGFQRIKPE
jgi:hypothetical protein